MSKRPNLKIWWDKKFQRCLNKLFKYVQQRWQDNNKVLKYLHASCSVVKSKKNVLLLWNRSLVRKVAQQGLKMSVNVSFIPSHVKNLLTKRPYHTICISYSSMMIRTIFIILENVLRPFDYDNDDYVWKKTFYRTIVEKIYRIKYKNKVLPGDF